MLSRKKGGQLAMFGTLFKVGPVKDCGLISALTPLDGFLLIAGVFISWALTDALRYCMNEVQAKGAPRST